MNYKIGQKVKTGIAEDWTGEPIRVIIVGELTDGRFLCERMPFKHTTLTGEIAFFSDDDGLFLRGKVKDVKEEIL